MVQDTAFEADPDDRRPGDPLLVVDVAGFEGPLDLLLDLARRQKVDLHEISVLALAEQYLAFIETARTMRLELAADYLVMAAWLAYLKSRLLLPEPPRPEGPGACDLATALAFRLRRLEAVRTAAGRLADRPQLGREMFARGAPEPPVDTLADASRPRFESSLYELLAAYAAQRERGIAVRVTVARRQVWSLADARDALERLAGQSVGWIVLESWLLRFWPDPAFRKTMLASALAAALEMVREGQVSLRQDEPFSPLLLRRPEPHLRVVTS